MNSKEKRKERLRNGIDELLRKKKVFSSPLSPHDFPPFSFSLSFQFASQIAATSFASLSEHMKVSPPFYCLFEEENFFFSDFSPLFFGGERNVCALCPMGPWPVLLLRRGSIFVSFSSSSLSLFFLPSSVFGTQSRAAQLKFLSPKRRPTANVSYL